MRHELAADVRRYASASALAELVLRFAPTEPNEEIYIRLVAYLDTLSSVSEEHLETTSLSALWGIVCALGFEPSMDGCARDGREIPEGAATFSISDGGLSALRGMSKLHSLVLRNCNVTDSGLVHLKRLPNLRNLDLSGTKVTTKACRLSLSLPISRPCTLKTRSLVTRALLNSRT